MLALVPPAVTMETLNLDYFIIVPLNSRAFLDFLELRSNRSDLYPVRATEGKTHEVHMGEHVNVIKFTRKLSGEISKKQTDPCSTNTELQHSI